MQKALVYRTPTPSISIQGGPKILTALANRPLMTSVSYKMKSAPCLYIPPHSTLRLQENDTCRKFWPGSSDPCATIPLTFCFYSGRSRDTWMHPWLARREGKRSSATWSCSARLCLSMEPCSMSERPQTEASTTSRSQGHEPCPPLLSPSSLPSSPHSLLLHILSGSRTLRAADRNSTFR